MLRSVRQRSRLTLRALAERAGTSHATLAAYESGSKVPRVDTLARIVRAAGFEPSVDLTPCAPDRRARGEELVDVLLLAEQFPARHTKTLRYPRFG